MKLSIQLTKKHIFMISLLVLLIGIGVVYAYNSGGPPVTMGHSWEEIEAPAPLNNPSIICTTQNSGDNDCIDAKGSGGGIQSVENVSNDGGNIDLIAGTGMIITSDDGANTITLSSTGDGEGFWEEDFTNKIHYNGRVGIGFNSPAERLHIVGNAIISEKLRVGSNNLPEYTIDARKSVNGKTVIYVENSASADSSTAVYGISTATTGTTYGTVGISQNSKGIGLYGDGGSRGVWGKGLIGVYGRTESTATNAWGIFCDTPDGGGKCGGDKSWTVNSDERLKKDIKTINNPLEKVLRLRGVSFYFKGDTKNQDPHLGLIAQEVLPIVPEVISKNPEGFYAMETEELTALLIEAIKEQQQTIEKQNKVIWQQHNEMARLKKAICEISPNSEICNN